MSNGAGVDQWILAQFPIVSPGIKLHWHTGYEGDPLDERKHLAFSRLVKIWGFMSDELD